MLKCGVALAAVAAAFVLVAAALAAPGTLLTRKSASGQFATVAMSADAKKPAAIYVNLLGGIQGGLANVACSKGFSISSNSYTRNRAGLYRLPVRPAGADTCTVILSISGSGRIVGEIRAIKR